MCHHHWKRWIDCGLTTCIKSSSYKPPIPETKPESFDYWIKHYANERAVLEARKVQVLERHVRELAEADRAIEVTTQSYVHWTKKRMAWEEEQQQAEAAQKLLLEEQAKKKAEALADPKLRAALELFGVVIPDTVQ